MACGGIIPLLGKRHCFPVHDDFFLRYVVGNNSFCLFSSYFGLKIEFLQDYKSQTLVGAFGGYLVLAIVLAVIRKIGEKFETKEEVVE